MLHPPLFWVRLLFPALQFRVCVHSRAERLDLIRGEPQGPVWLFPQWAKLFWWLDFIPLKVPYRNPQRHDIPNLEILGDCCGSHLQPGTSYRFCNLEHGSPRHVIGEIYVLRARVGKGLGCTVFFCLC